MPAGIEIAGIPARFTGHVHISDIYIFKGSPAFSPILKAVETDVGDMRTSYFLNALLKSLIIRVLTLCAFS
ncbi:MAG: hypothetical protein BWY62_01161 [Firmicutes bacterium ADurb.Bin356]|nr:MAG: hypothetical protein BWY62_01161 [Firmicutes bacterium ADurb.Bin356]